MASLQRTKITLFTLALPMVLVPAFEKAEAGADNQYCLLGDQANFGKQDGPATLPKACYFTALSATPSKGSILNVSPGLNTIQDQFSKGVQCGDTLVLEAGQVYEGPIKLPNLACDQNHYVTIRTSDADKISQEGERISPCYQKVKHLNGRPTYSCPTDHLKHLPILYVNSENTPVISVDPGANHYRLIGLEITQVAGLQQNALVNLKGANHIIIDRSWVHGSATDQTQAGVDADGAYLAVIDSYINDTKCRQQKPAACIDSQAVSAGVSDFAEGPIKIVNNFLETSGESFLFGGGTATYVPKDIEIRRNHSFKPLIWRKDDPHYFGTGFVVKNLGEFKNGSRALVEGNVFENNWVGQSDQFGFAVLFTPKNPNDTCPVCIVTDVTLRGNSIRHVSEGISVAAAEATQGHTESLGIHRISIHDNLFDDVNGPKWNKPGSCCTGGMGFEIGNFQSTPGSGVTDLNINHNTFLLMGFPHGGGLGLLTNNYPTVPFDKLTIENNIAAAGFSGGYGSGFGGGISGVIQLLNALANPNWIFALNLLPVAVWDKQYVNDNYPTSNIECGTDPSGQSVSCFPNDYSQMFVNYHSGNGGDYHLAPNSPYKNAGTDKHDLGANIDYVNMLTSGVD